MNKKQAKRAAMTRKILDAALILAREGDYRRVTRQQIADEADIPPSLISHYYPTMPQLRRAIMSAAVDREDLAVLIQGLVAGDAKAKAAPIELKRRAAEGVL